MRALLDIEIRPLAVPSVAEMGSASSASLGLINLGDLPDAVLDDLCLEWVANVKARAEEQRALERRKRELRAKAVADGLEASYAPPK